MEEKVERGGVEKLVWEGRLINAAHRRTDLLGDFGKSHPNITKLRARLTLLHDGTE